MLEGSFLPSGPDSERLALENLRRGYSTQFFEYPRATGECRNDTVGLSRPTTTWLRFFFLVLRPFSVEVSLPLSFRTLTRNDPGEITEGKLNKDSTGWYSDDDIARNYLGFSTRSAECESSALPSLSLSLSLFFFHIHDWSAWVSQRYTYPSTS